MIKALVIAGNYEQFRYWAGEHWREYKYVSRTADLRGIRDVPLYLVGTPWWDNPQYPKLHDEAEAMGLEVLYK